MYHSIKMWFVLVSVQCLLNHTDSLAHRVRVVGNLEVREMFADFLCHLLRSEAHCSNVICPQRQLALRSLHELQCSTVAVRDVHHGKAGVRTQVALMVTGAESIMEDLYCVVCKGRGMGCSVNDILLVTVNLCTMQPLRNAVPVVPPPGGVLTDITPG